MANENMGQSPTQEVVPSEAHDPKPTNKVLMAFPEAIRAIIDGNRVTKAEWDNEEVYGYMTVGGDGKLCIHNEGESATEYHPWNVSHADMVGEDWYIL